MERTVHDPRWTPAKHRPRWPHTMAVCLSIILCALIVSNSVTTRPLLKVETLPPPLAHPAVLLVDDPPTGPFRPRPKPPEPPVPPAPQPENDAERRIFPRVEALIESRLTRIEARAAARAEQRLGEALEEINENMDAVVQGADPELIQAGGAFGGVFVAKLAAFVKKAVMYIIAAVVLTVLGALVVKYWFIVGPVAAFLFIVLPAWSARTFGKKATP